jgi:hypothetical protein
MGYLRCPDRPLIHRFFEIRNGVSPCWTTVGLVGRCVPMNKIIPALPTLHIHNISPDTLNFRGLLGPRTFELLTPEPMLSF